MDLEANSSGNPVINTQYLLTDNLGSVDGATDVNGALVASTGWSFEAFGKRRNPATWQGTASSAQVSADRSSVTNRGYTGHEMLDNVGLVHMNGRVYDSNLGRFLSVDPMFAHPENSQSLNPYSYVLNNPLSLTDPTGYADSGTCQAGQQNSCPQSGSGTTTTTHVDTTPTGSHIAVSGTITATKNADGSISATANNKTLSSALSAGARAFAGGSGYFLNH